MSEETKTIEAEKNIEGTKAAESDKMPPKGKPISHPREVAALVLTQINRVNAMKDELTIAIKGLSDITQQLATSYGKQMLVIEQLARRINGLEGKDGKNGESKKTVNGQAAA